MKKGRYGIFCWLCLLCLAIANGKAQSTLPPELQQKARAEISSRGLDEAAVRARLLTRGINIDQVTPEQLPSLQAQIEAVLQELDAEQQAAKAPAVAPPAEKPAESGQTPPENNPPVGAAQQAQVQEKVKQGASVEEALSETLSAEAQQALPPAQVYGHHLFRDKSLPLFRTTNEVKPPDSYVLSAGDELTISIFGISQFDSKFTIGKDGYIQPSQMPKIFLKGVRLGQAKELLRSRFANFYRFAPEQFAVTLSTARTITVNLFGELNHAGSFTISAVNTAFNALVAAGGPSDIGSVRNIEVMRGSQKKRLDIYAFLGNPSVQYDFFLEDNDLLYVPVAARVVGISGAINREFRYELIDNEQLVKLIEYGGGLRANAYREVVQVRRYVDDKQVLIDVELKNLLREKRDFTLLNGDEVFIRRISAPVQNFAAVGGAVDQAGRYALAETPRLSSLLQRSGLRREARTDLAFLLRRNPDNTQQLIQLNPALVLANPNSAQDLPLQAEDSLMVYQQARFVTKASISVRGAVRDTLRAFPFDPDSNLTLQRVILLAGGLLDDANGLGYLVRTNPLNSKQKEYLPVNLREALDRPNGPANVSLRPFDELEVLSTSNYADAASVHVYGAVRRPGTLRYGPSLTLRDALLLSGGLKLEASLNRVEVFRLEFQNDRPTRTSVAALQIDSSLNIIGSDRASFHLRPFDEIVVRSAPQFELLRTVEVQGEINYPGHYALLDNNEALSSVIARAGGLTPESFAAGATVYRSEGNKGLVVAKLDRALKDPQSPQNIILQGGDLITVPKSESLVSIRTANTLAGEVYARKFALNGQINTAFMPRKRAGWYIRHYAAGFNRNADSSKVTVEYPNGRIRGTSDFGLFRVYPKIVKGAIISVGAKPPKAPDNKEKKSIDWDKAFTQILAAATATATILLAVSALNK